MAPPSILAAARAMKNRRNGTESPSLRPASTLSAWRMRMGTRGLFTMIWPRPASVGARMALRIPASQMESCGNTSRATTAPRRIVSNMPVLSNRAGRLRMLRKTFRSVRLASVKSSITSPTSARWSAAFAVNPARRIPCKAGNISIPAAVNTIGAVTIVCSSRLDARLNRNRSKTKTARGTIAVRLS